MRLQPNELRHGLWVYTETMCRTQLLFQRYNGWVYTASVEESLRKKHLDHRVVRTYVRCVNTKQIVAPEYPIVLYILPSAVLNLALQKMLRLCSTVMSHGDKGAAPDDVPVRLAA